MVQINKEALLQDLALAEQGKLKKPIKIAVSEKYRELLGKVVILVSDKAMKSKLKNVGTRLVVTFDELIKIKQLIEVNTTETRQVIAFMRAFSGSIVQ